MILQRFLLRDCLQGPPRQTILRHEGLFLLSALGRLGFQERSLKYRSFLNMGLNICRTSLISRRYSKVHKAANQALISSTPRAIKRTVLVWVPLRRSSEAESCRFFRAREKIARDCDGLLQENHQMLAWFIPPVVVPTAALLTIGAAALLQ
jgi:hypothetical protein